MADLTKAIEGVVTLLVTTGAGAASTWLAVFRETRKKITALEERLGVSEPTKTGVFLAISLVEESIKKLRREVDLWEDDPPAWAKRLVARSRTQSANDQAFEEQTTRSLKDVRDRFKRLEEDVEDLATKLHDREDIVSREEYVQDSKLRAEEMVKVREQLAMANGLLRGVMAAMGYIDAEPRHPGSEGR